MSDPAPAASAGEFTCANCATLASGSHCPACGQKRIHEGDLALRHAWHHVAHELTHLDGKVFTTLRLLLTRPGQLTLDFLEGRRARHIHPIRVFIAIGFLFFLLAKLNPPFDVGEAFGPTLQGDALATLDRRAADLGTTREALLAKASAASAAAFKTVSLCATFAGGFVLWLLFRRQRRYLAEHLVMTLHLASFNMCLWLVLGWFTRIPATQLIAGLITSALAFGYFLWAARRVYGGSWLVLVLKWAGVEAVKGLIMFGALLAVWVRALIKA